MSALFGMVSIGSTKVTAGALDGMRDRMRHRGPDGGADWCGGRAGLGHLMLHTTPESEQERLPLVHTSGDFVITADLRLDNREELLADLGFSPGRSSQTGDAELVLETWLQHREQAPGRLLGDFAFAIWDKKRDTLFAARDHFGVKPFFYHHSQVDFLAFATEIRGLFSIPCVPRKLNGSRFADYLIEAYHLNPPDHPDTFYEGVYRLPAGSYLSFGPGGLSISRYWRLQPGAELRLKSENEYSEAFRSHFERAVACRMRSRQRIGAQLSGGLDSSSVVCQMRELRKSQGVTDPIPTYSITYPDFPRCDESEYIEAVIGQGGVKSAKIRADTEGPLSVRDSFFTAMDEGDLGSAAQQLIGMNSACARDSVRIVLDGLDGDTTVGHGYHYFAELARSGRWKEFQDLAQGFNHAGLTPDRLFLLFASPYFRELAEAKRVRSLLAAYLGASKNLKPGPDRLFLNHAFRPLVPKRIKSFLRRSDATNATRREVVATRLMNELLSPELIKRLDLKERIRLLWERQRPAAVSEMESQWRTLSGCGITFTLELHDQMSGSAGLESWHPFMDKRLIEFCLSVPGALKVRDGFERWIMRDALSSILPQEVSRRRDKAMMTENFYAGFIRRDFQAVDQFVRQIETGDGGLLQKGPLRHYFQKIQDASGLGSEDVFAFYRLVTGCMWLEAKDL